MTYLYYQTSTRTIGGQENNVSDKTKKEWEHLANKEKSESFRHTTQSTCCFRQLQTFLDRHHVNHLSPFCVSLSLSPSSLTWHRLAPRQPWSTRRRRRAAQRGSVPGRAAHCGQGQEGRARQAELQRLQRRIRQLRGLKVSRLLQTGGRRRKTSLLLPYLLLLLLLLCVVNSKDTRTLDPPPLPA